MKTLFEILTIIGGILAMLMVVIGTLASTPIAQAVYGIYACALVIIPYCMSRMMS